MKRILFIASLVLLVSTPLFAAKRNIVDEVIRMQRAGVSPETIIGFVQSTKDPIVLTADDIIDMTERGVPKEVIKAMVDESKAQKERESNDDDRAVYVGPYPYWAPFWDPYWYQPRLYVNFGIDGHGHGHGHGGHRGR